MLEPQSIKERLFLNASSAKAAEYVVQEIMRWPEAAAITMIGGTQLERWTRDLTPRVVSTFGLTDSKNVLTGGRSNPFSALPETVAAILLKEAAHRFSFGELFKEVERGEFS